MTGTIVSWHAETKRGILQADNGQRIPFRGNSVWPYDLLTLESAQRVHFELRDGTPLRAVCLTFVAGCPNHS